MSMKYLGETFDFHGGGSDLIFRIMKMRLHNLKAVQVAIPLLNTGCITGLSLLMKRKCLNH